MRSSRASLLLYAVQRVQDWQNVWSNFAARVLVWMLQKYQNPKYFREVYYLSHAIALLHSSVLEHRYLCYRVWRLK